MHAVGAGLAALHRPHWRQEVAGWPVGVGVGRGNRRCSAAGLRSGDYCSASTLFVHSVMRRKRISTSCGWPSCVGATVLRVWSPSVLSLGASSARIAMSICCTRWNEARARVGGQGPRRVSGRGLPQARRPGLAALARGPRPGRGGGQNALRDGPSTSMFVRCATLARGRGGM